MQAIVVTGVSSGIGRAIAGYAVQNNFHVFGNVRTEEDAEHLRSAFADAVTPLVFDVRDEASIARSAAIVRESLAGQTLRGLVNNAGLGLVGPLLYQPIEDIRAVLDTNLLGPILVTRAFAPLLGTDPAVKGPKGRIVNMSSIAGKIAQPFAGAYVASKHALEGLSDVMRLELKLHGIAVSIVAPATVKTPIWDRPEATIGRYDATEFGPSFDKGVRSVIDGARAHGLDPKDVAKIVWRALTHSRPRLRYAPAQHAIVEQILPRLAPDRVIDFVVGKSLGLKPASKPTSPAEP